MIVKYLDNKIIKESKSAFLPRQYGSYYEIENDTVFNCSDDQLRNMVAEEKLKKVKNLAHDTVDVVKYGLVDSDARNVDAVIIGPMRRRRPSEIPVYVSAGWLKRHAEKFLASPKSAYNTVFSNLTDWSYTEIETRVKSIASEASKLDDNERIYVGPIRNSYYAKNLTNTAKRISDDSDEYSVEFDDWDRVMESPALLFFAYDSNPGEDMFVSKRNRIHVHSVYDDRRLFFGNFNFDSVNVPIITNKQFTRIMNENNVMTLDTSIIESFNEADDATRKVLASVICSANMNDPETIGIVAYILWKYNLRYYCTTADYALIGSTNFSGIWRADAYFEKVKKAGGIVTDALYEMIANECFEEIKCNVMSDLKSQCGMNGTLLKKICQKIGVVDYTSITLKEIKKETECNE